MITNEEKRKKVVPKSVEDDESYLLDEERKALLLLEDAHLQLAKEDLAAFNTYVLRDEETGARIENSDYHDLWAGLIEEHDRLVIYGHFECGKTLQISVGYSLFSLGRDPNLRIACVSNTDAQAKKICGTVKRYIDKSAPLKRVFPNLRADKAEAWSAHKLFVERETKSKDSSFETCGLHGNILGSRIDILILDDVLDFESTRTPEMRQDTIDWVRSTLIGRLSNRSKVICLGMVWTNQDLMHWLADNRLYYSMRCPITDERGMSTWSKQWPQKRIEAKRIELGPVEARRQLDCEDIDEDERRFKLAWINTCKARGEGFTLIDQPITVREGFRTITGVDLGVRDKDESAETVFFTIGIYPNGDRRVLNIVAGKWHGPDIVGGLRDVQRKFNSTAYVENNSAQQFIVDFMPKDYNMPPVIPFTTNQRVNHPEFGVEAIGAEMAAGKWIIPCTRSEDDKLVCHPEVDKWINELLFYTVRGHNGDRLMASWFAREGANIVIPPPKKGGYTRLDLISR